MGIKNIVNDIRTAVKVVGEVKKARKAGAGAAEIKVVPMKVLPVINVGASIYDTVEGCTLSWCDKEIVKAAREAFNALDCEEQHRLAFAPKDGEFIERANLWREILTPVMSPKQLRIAMLRILAWYIHIKDLRRTGEVK